MLTEERYELILNELQKNGVVYASELVQMLNTSESTIRRDLNFLDKLGKLKKVHGGATLASKNIQSKDNDIDIRKTMNTDEKLAIAKYAASLIEDNDFVYLDSGTTTELMIDFIDKYSVVFVTNGINQAKKLSRRGFKTYILAGEIKGTTEAIIGIEAVNSLKRYNFTKGFFGANGVSVERGYMTPEINEALVKEEAVKRTAVGYALIDNSKFDEVSNITFSNIEDLNIITSNKDNRDKEKIKEETEVLEVTLE